MKTATKIFLLLFFTITISISLSGIAEARMPATYPVWGYNAQDHICQIKQGFKDGLINEDLVGDYWGMRECRFDNPEIIFYTGGGILIWFGIFLFSILLHHAILPKLEKRTKAEKTLFFLQDIGFIAIIMFLTVLIQHYFDIPKAVYDYQSDIDHIIYSTFIRAQIPIIFAAAYAILSFGRIVFVYIKNKR